MSSPINSFLQKNQRRAYVTALVATRHHEDSLDIVQNAMFDLYRKYETKPHNEWGALFHRILHSKINDWHRRQKSYRARFTEWLHGEEDDSLMDPYTANFNESPEHLLHAEQTRELFMHRLAALPLRQKQAFMLRIWDGLNTEQTAYVMGCSTGSVKTHLSRATNSLQMENDGDAEIEQKRA